MTLLLDVTIKVSFIVGLALMASGLLRRQSAALRHWILAVSLAAAAAVPVLSFVAPAWTPGWLDAEPIAFEVATGEIIISKASSLNAESIPANVADAPWILAIVWSAGMIGCLAMLAAGALRLSWIASRAKHIHDDRWIRISRNVAQQYGIRRRIRLLLSGQQAMLVTWGGLRPRVLLPAGAETWPEDRIRVVLSHELAHVSRWDWLTQMTAELLRAIYWFNPFLWAACRRIKRESEHACDDAALNLGISGTDYAAHLLELARTFKQSNRAWSPALAMARQSTLERRFTAMLDPVKNRNAVTRRAVLASLAIAICITIPLAGLTSSPVPVNPEATAEASQGVMTLAGKSPQGANIGDAGVVGVVTDAAGTGVPRATVIISSPDGRTERISTTSLSGRYSISHLQPGNYVLQVFASGFGPSRMTNIQVTEGQNLHQDLRMDIGFVANQLTAADRERLEVQERYEATVQRYRLAVEEARARGEAPPPPPGPGPQRIGGSVATANLVSQVQPLYPPLAREASVSGIVILETHINEEGIVEGVRVISGHPLLAPAAVDAVKQWRYRPTFLNGAPVDVVTTVTVNFSLGNND